MGSALCGATAGNGCADCAHIAHCVARLGGSATISYDEPGMIHVSASRSSDNLAGLSRGAPSDAPITWKSERIQGSNMPFCVIASIQRTARARKRPAAAWVEFALLGAGCLALASSGYCLWVAK